MPPFGKGYFNLKSCTLRGHWSRYVTISTRDIIRFWLWLPVIMLAWCHHWHWVWCEQEDTGLPAPAHTGHRSQRPESEPVSGARPASEARRGRPVPRPRPGRASLASSGGSSYEPEWSWPWLLGFKGCGRGEREERGVPDPSHFRPLRSGLAWAHTA